MDAEQSAETPLDLPADQVTINITFDRRTSQVTIGGDGWEWVRDEALCDWMLKKAARMVEGVANQAAQAASQARVPPDAAKRAELLKALRNGAGG